jgi:ATP-dependent Clp protease protease subunit
MSVMDNKKTNKKNNSNNTEKFLEYGIDIDNRIIHLVYEIDAAATAVVLTGIQLMVARTRERPIDIYVNSMGGCPYSAMGLYSYIRTLHDVQVNTYNIGCAMSAASIIFLAGDNRYMYRYTAFMLHTVSSGAYGKIFPNLEDETEECKKIHKDICEIYAKHTNKTYKQWNQLIKYKDRYYRHAEALDIGIVHKVIERT